MQIRAHTGAWMGVSCIAAEEARKETYRFSGVLEQQGVTLVQDEQGLGGSLYAAVQFGVGRCGGGFREFQPPGTGAFW